MTAWEHARLRREIPSLMNKPATANVTFSHGEGTEEVEPDGWWDKLRQLGDQGWEMVAQSTDQYGFEVWLKRPRV